MTNLVAELTPYSLSIEEQVRARMAFCAALDTDAVRAVAILTDLSPQAMREIRYSAELLSATSAGLLMAAQAMAALAPDALPDEVQGIHVGRRP